MEKPIKVLKKLHAVQKDVEYMQKGGRNSAQNYSFLSERQITERFKELFEKHGIFFHYSSTITATRTTPSGKQTLTDVLVEYKFIDVESGESIEGQAVGQGTDANDKGVYKAVTGAIKYIFMKTFLIPTGDDPEEDSKDPALKRRTATRSVMHGLSPTERNDAPFHSGYPKDDDED